MTSTSAVWHCTFYVANRFGSMQERVRTFPGDLSQAQAQSRAYDFLTTLRRQGIPTYPHYDLALSTA